MNSLAVIALALPRSRTCKLGAGGTDRKMKREREMVKAHVPSILSLALFIPLASLASLAISPQPPHPPLTFPVPLSIPSLSLPLSLRPFPLRLSICLCSMAGPRLAGAVIYQCQNEGITVGLALP